MLTRGSVTFTCPRALAEFVGRLVETTTAVFEAKQTGDSEWTVEFSGGF
jgi:hypothetical protein